MKGAMMLLALVLLQASSALAAEATRSLPKGEEHPEIIERLYASPFGEVQITTLGLNGHSGFLRTGRGSLMGFRSVSGAPACEQWFHSDKAEPLPPGNCEFLFKDEQDGTFQAVRSGEMTEASLFQATRGWMRGWRNHVSL